ncbi:MAG: 50S ribosomal protein L11 methyltransferase [Deltaproteobacteria bacterium]|nr:50S ribosomal protein L11 methyltransferase [Deltaproteobacteria bacterium]
MQKEWTQISCEVPDAMVDTIAEFLVELSSNGVGIDNRTLDTFSLESLEETPTKTVTAYFQNEKNLHEILRDIEAFLVENGPNFPGFSYQAPTIRTITDEDWSTSWKEHFKPLRVGKHLVIKPTWEDFPSDPDDILLNIDPGMAFGTGTHPTTMLCLTVLEKILSGLQTRGKSLTALDVGTGSGILTIAAAKLGIGQCTAVDIDPEAVRIAGENCILNGVEEKVTVSDTPLALISGGFDIVLANILAEDLVRMAADLIAHLNPHGFLILSGILIEKESMVINGYENSTMTLTEVSREGEWSCLVLRRNG